LVVYEKGIIFDTRSERVNEEDKPLSSIDGLAF
jgi:hypothetical protein